MQILWSSPIHPSAQVGTILLVHYIVASRLANVIAMHTYYID